MKTQFNCRLSAGTLADIRDAAATLGVSQATVIVLAVRSLYRRELDKIPKKIPKKT